MDTETQITLLIQILDAAKAYNQNYDEANTLVAAVLTKLKDIVDSS